MSSLFVKQDRCPLRLSQSQICIADAAPSRLTLASKASSELQEASASARRMDLSVLDAAVSASGIKPKSRDARYLVASLIGHLGSSTFRLSTAACRCCSRARASLRNRHQGPSIMGFEDEAEQGGLAVRRTADPSDQANSPHPSSREGHHATTRWSSSFLL